MRAAKRIVEWIDRGYDEAVARSNYAMGLLLSVCGLLAWSVDNRFARTIILFIAASVFILFGWRMILSFRRRAAASAKRMKRRQKVR